MPRIAGVTIPAEKRIEVSLTYIYGIGPTKSKYILEKAKVDKNIRAKDLSEGELDKIPRLLEKEEASGG
jgi:small subunit ribosomal protein S13